MNKGALVIIPVIIVVLIAFGGMFVIDETEQVVLTQFGKLVVEPTSATGL